MKVAIYARYSSENQRDASITDQYRVCREFAQRQGWHVAAEYSDHAVSGATIMRPGFPAMMREALEKKVDIVMAEALDRFSRDQEDTAGLFKRLTFAGVNIVTLAEGDITHLHIGLRALTGTTFSSHDPKFGDRDELRAKPRWRSMVWPAHPLLMRSPFQMVTPDLVPRSTRSHPTRVLIRASASARSIDG